MARGNRYNPNTGDKSLPCKRCGRPTKVGDNAAVVIVGTAETVLCGDCARVVAPTSHDGKPGSTTLLGSKLDRRHLIAHNVEKMEHIYSQQSAKEGPDQVVMVIDARDVWGGRIARAAQGDEAVDRSIAHFAANGVIPTQILALPRASASELLSKFSPTSAAQLMQPSPDGSFWVVCLADGGTTLALHPVPIFS